MIRTQLFVFIFSLFKFYILAEGVEIPLTLHPQELTIKVNENSFFIISSQETFSTDIYIDLYLSKDGIVNSSNSVIYPSNSTEDLKVPISGIGVGHTILTANSTSQNWSSASHNFIRITVLHSHALAIICEVVGWIYFVAWSVSFYPQIFENWRRKSVVGLSFDFLALNISGFFSYGLFNIALFWIPLVQEQYFKNHVDGVNPVQANDVFFTLHAFLATFVTILQCFLYERNDQKVSWICRLILSVIVTFFAITLILVLTNIITWLNYFYFFSYVKLGISVIKYIPQAYFNFKRQCTIGWSIGNVLLDFTGGILSVAQMFILSYNNDDWSSIFGDPTKFGLGVLSIIFDIIFIVQHYCLYRLQTSYESLNTGSVQTYASL